VSECESWRQDLTAGAGRRGRDAGEGSRRRRLRFFGREPPRDADSGGKRDQYSKEKD
jgi:hypothetical protein